MSPRKAETLWKNPPRKSCGPLKYSPFKKTGGGPPPAKWRIGGGTNYPSGPAEKLIPYGWTSSRFFFYYLNFFGARQPITRARARAPTRHRADASETPPQANPSPSHSAQYPHPRPPMIRITRPSLQGPPTCLRRPKPARQS